MKIFHFVFGLFVVLAVCACHPSASNKKDLLEGIELGETGIPFSRIAQHKEFCGRSPYFKTGFDYGALKSACKMRRQFMAHDLGDFSAPIIYSKGGEKYMMQEKQNVTAQLSAAWTSLHEDLNATSMTPEAFGQLVGDDRLPALLAQMPSSDF